jgi:hypothetical protein
MKKAVSLLVALALFATTAFAAPVSVAASLPEPAQTVVSGEQTAPEAFSAIDETGDLFADALFADVGGTPLTTTEAGQVDGGCIPPIPLILIAAAILLAVQTCSPQPLY